MFTIKSPYVVEALIFRNDGALSWGYLNYAFGRINDVCEWELVLDEEYEKVVRVTFDDGDTRFYRTTQDSYSSWSGDLWRPLREVVAESVDRVVYKEV